MKLFMQNRKLCIVGITMFLIIGGMTACSTVSVSDHTDVSSTITSDTDETSEQSAFITNAKIETDSLFSLRVPGNGGSVMLAPDADMSELLPLLGNSYTYYEAPSCAFHGLDKIYTFNDFEIDTYPDGELDRIYLISLLSDMVGTNEGLMIGSPEAQIVALYGEPQEMKGSEYIYQRGKTRLGVVAKEGYVGAITFYSSVQ